MASRRLAATVVLITLATLAILAGTAAASAAASSLFSSYFQGLPPASLIWVVLAGLAIAGLAIGTVVLAASGDQKAGSARSVEGEARILRLEAELRAAEEATDLYLDTVGHEIGNLNHIIMGYLELASEKLPPGSEERELVEKPRAALEASTRIIRSLQSIQLARTGKLEQKTICLDRLLAGLAAESAQKGSATVRYTGLPGAPVSGNELLQEAFRNILQAATWLSSTPPTIDISLSGAGARYYRVAVESPGSGLPEHLRDRLFTPHNATHTTGCIKGPGLYLAKLALESCGGTILAENVIEGGLCRGCRFVVQLPAASATGEARGTGNSGAGT